MTMKLEEIAALLHIHEKALAHGGALSNIRDAALRELQKINGEMAVPVESTYIPTALDKELAGTAASEPPPMAEPQPDSIRRI